LIADQSVRCRLVEVVEYLPHPRRSLPLLAYIIIKVGHVMTGLITMRVLTDEASNIGLLATRSTAFGAEQLIELAGELLWSTQEFDQATDVLGHEETVLPGVRLGKTKTHFAWGEGCQPATVASGAHEPRFRIKDILVRLSPSEIALVVVIV